MGRRRGCGLQRREHVGLRPSCRLVSSHPPPLPRADGTSYCTQSHPGLARQHRAAASQISLCRVLSLFDCRTRPRPSPALPNASTRGREGSLLCEASVAVSVSLYLTTVYNFAAMQCHSSANCSPSAFSRSTKQGTQGRTPANANARQATLPLRKTVWGNPQKLEGIKIPQLACLPSPWQSRHQPCVRKHVLHEALSNWPGMALGRLISLPLRCIQSPRSISPPTTALELRSRSWLTCLVARHSGPCRRMRVKRVPSPQRHFPAGLAVWILEIEWAM